jgi:hypothetical protein
MVRSVRPVKKVGSLVLVTGVKEKSFPLALGEAFHLDFVYSFFISLTLVGPETCGRMRCVCRAWVDTALSHTMLVGGLTSWPRKTVSGVDIVLVVYRGLISGCFGNFMCAAGGVFILVRAILSPGLTSMFCALVHFACMFLLYTIIFSNEDILP